VTSDFKAFDLQVNGYAGVDFNSDGLKVEALRRAVDLMVSHGTERFLATVISDSPEKMQRRIRALVDCSRADTEIGRRMTGIHIEGPFLNPVDGYRGAHPLHAITDATPDAMDRLLEAGDGTVRLVTLAPECDARFATTRYLVDKGIKVAAGHCNPSLEELEGAIDAGLSIFTHLGNGCPMMMHRHDNIVQRVLSLADRLWITLIADLAHVPRPAFENYIQLAGLDRVIVITDAISASGLGPGNYRLGDWELAVGEDLVARSPDGSHFVGSCSTMASVQANLRAVGFSVKEIAKLVWENANTALEC